MAKQRTATRKRKRATRKKKPPVTESPADPGDAAAVQTAVEESAVALEERSAAKPGKRRSVARRKKTSRRSVAEQAASSERDGAPLTERAPDAAEVAPREQPEADAPNATKKKRKRTRRRAKRPAATAPDAPRVKPVSPSAEVEQSDDLVVIRFPSSAPPTDPATAPSGAEKETPQVSVETQNAVSGNGVAVEPPIDWDTADEVAEAAAEPPAPAEPSAPPGAAADDPGVALAENDEASEAQPVKDETAARRPKRRRRTRKKRDPRLAPEKPAPSDEPPEETADRRPAEPAAGATEEAAAAEEQPTRRRRRRTRRGRKAKASSTMVEARDATATETGPAAAGGHDAREARAPSGGKEMIINVVPHEECRIAIMGNGKLQEIYLERASAENYVGNIYKGVVTNVEPSIQAAFIDFGQGKNGFLHISDLHPQYFPDGEGQTENVGRKMPRRSRPPIQRCLRRKQELLVQITKEGIGTKGPTLTTYLSIPGRFLVMMPGMRQLGVSRKIEDDEARRKLRDQLAELELPENIGFIARTAALDHTKRELQSDLNYLTRLWKAVAKRIKSQSAPAELYTESDLVIRTIRDVYTSDISRIIIDDSEVAQRANEFLSIFSPRARDTVVEYSGPEPIFHRYGIEVELERLHSRHVPLKSGGSLVIDQTEALVAIDVNSGRFRTEDDAEATAFKINLESADEIPRQLRLRDLGGVVICDFIDMRQEKHKREIERRLNRNLKEHKERAKILRMSDFGIIEMTRQRQRASLTRSVYQDCRFCHGTGLVKTAESVALDVMRLIQLAVTRENIRTIEVSVSPEVGHLLQNRKRAQLHDLEAENRHSISIRTDASFSLDQIQIQCCDPRGRVVPHP